MNRPGQGGKACQSRGLVRHLRLALAPVGLALGCGAGLDMERPWTASLAFLTCSDEVQSTLVAWGAGDEMFTTPPGAGGEVRYHLPTREFGEWLRLETDGSGAKVSLVTPDRVRTRAFAEDCIASTMEEVDLPPADRGRRFTDEDLTRVVNAGSAAGSRGVVVYVWSPHMPLSVDGYSEISAAATSHGLDVVPLLFPGSDPGFAATEAQRVGIPDEGLIESASLELVFRDAQLHAPSIIIFDGSRVSAVLPGYRSAEGYREFLTEFIAAS